MPNIKYHPDVRGYAVNVKTLHMSFAEGGTEGQRERAWDGTQEVWWGTAGEIAKECGFSGVSGVGRSGGWCAPFDVNEAVPENRSDRYSYTEEGDDPRLPKFVERIEGLLRSTPDLYAQVLQEIIEEDMSARRHVEVARQVRNDAINFLAKNGAERLADMVEERWEIEE